MGSGVILRVHTNDKCIAKRCVLDLVENNLAASGYVYEVECCTCRSFETQYVADLYTDQNLSKRAFAYIAEHFTKTVLAVAEIATHDLSNNLYQQVRDLHR